jgi:hypothetical protein
MSLQPHKLRTMVASNHPPPLGVDEEGMKTKDETTSQTCSDEEGTGPRLYPLISVEEEKLCCAVKSEAIETDCHRYLCVVHLDIKEHANIIY